VTVVGASGAVATRAQGARLARAIETAAVADPVLVTLTGDLGAGKTTFVAGLLEALGHPGPVRSPTYTLVEPYRLAGRDIQHCDLYRLRHPDELEDLGLRELRNPGAVLLVEWPERAEGRLGRADIEVALAYDCDEARRIEIRAGTPAGRKILARL
jgi:tRNA threonylcarbamoyladenosine biosynthesis protein TsaE